MNTRAERLGLGVDSHANPGRKWTIQRRDWQFANNHNLQGSLCLLQSTLYVLLLRAHLGNQLQHHWRQQLIITILIVLSKDEITWAE